MEGTVLNFNNELASCNEKQLSIVQELDKNILLLASAGTGKTRTLSLRIANVLEKKMAEAEEILCLTFTNRACKEMTEKISEMLGKVGQRVRIKTFHSFCFDIIKEEAKEHTDIPSDFIIYDEEDTKEVIGEFNVNKFPVNSLQSFIREVKEKKAIYKQGTYEEIIISLYKYDIEKIKSICVDNNYKVRLDMVNYLETYGAKFIEAYNSRLSERHAVDFDDLLLNCNELFLKEKIVEKWRKKFKYLHIDEVQDTSELEYNIISKLFPGNNILMCGDKFQTIYAWRGSNPEIILKKFKEDYIPTFVAFDENYRSSETLLNASYGFLKNAFNEEVSEIYKHGIESKVSFTGDKIKLKIASDFNEEAKWIFHNISALKQQDVKKIAILTRGNRTAKDLSSIFTMINANIPKEKRLEFLLVDDFKFFRRQEIKDILSYLKLIKNPFDYTSLRRIIKRFVKGVGDKSIEEIESKDAKVLGIRLTDFINSFTLDYGEPYRPLLDGLSGGNVVIFDVESTGVDTEKDEIIQISAVRINAEGKILDKFERFLTPTKSVGTSYDVHGFSDDFLRENGEPKEKVLREFKQYVQDRIVLGHNVSYDINIFNSELKRLDLGYAEFITHFDTLDLSRRFYPRLKNHKLETLSNLFDTEVKSSHNAIDDVLATKDVLLNILTDKLLPILDEREEFYSRYSEKFMELCDDINDLREEAKLVRTFDIITHIVNISGIKDVYSKEPQRIENVRNLYLIAKEGDNETMGPMETLAEFLKLTALSNTEIESITSKRPKIPIITVHQAKGAEFDHVFLAGLQEMIFPSYQSVKSGDLREEARTFYVAMTRAKKNLYLSASRNGGKKPSRFLEMIPSEFIDNN